jgi:hypothetical protein
VTKLRDKLKGLLTEDPSGMESNRDKKRARPKSGMSEDKPGEEKREKAPAHQWPWRRAGKCQRQLLEAAETSHRDLERLTRGSHEVN